MSPCGACLRRSLKNLETDLSLDTYSLLLQPRTLITLAPSSLSYRTGHRRQTLLRAARPSIHRHSHSTLASLRKGHHRKQVDYLRNGSNAKNSPLSKDRRKAPWALTKVELRDAVARDKNRSRLREETEEIEDVAAEEDGDVMRPSELPEPTKKQEVEAWQKHQIRKESEKQERKLVRQDEKQIEVYYKDPLQLAEGVLQRLRVPDIEGALRLVRASQAYEIKNIVSWNHCCDWLMAQGQVKQALAVYNEMKKRGQKPDAHTYTIMLRGLSQHVDKPNAVQEAVKIYNSIFAPNSAVKPNTIHTNAIINVCARGGDMDSLWAVAGRLPERGAGSPDRITFSTILNAIRENTVKEVTKSADGLKLRKTPGAKSEEEAAEERTRLYAKAVEDARKLWEDISYRWRRADLVIDEQLVCAMGRLLLACGVDNDIEQVLDLVEVTMNLRLKERGNQAKQPGQWLQGPADPSALPLLLKESNIYATPGPNTLSMVLQACSQKRSIQHLSKIYWRRLTDPNGAYKIRPDAGNIVTYLRLLRLQRASADALELLSQDWSQDIAKVLYRRASFIIALSTCVRDKNNPNVFKTAQKMLRIAEEKSEERAVGMFDDNVALGNMNYHKRKQILQEKRKELADMTPEEQEEMARTKDGVQSISVDPKILNYYLEVAVATTPGWYEAIRGKDDGTVFERHPSKNNTLSALITLAARTKDLKRLVKAKMEEVQNSDMPRRRRQDVLDPRAGSRVGENFPDMLDLMRSMISAWDRCLEVHERFKKAGREALDEKLMAGFQDRKREMTAYAARIEKAMGQKVQNRDFTSVRQEESAKEEGIEDEDSTVPDIERRIKAVLGGVDSTLIRSRAEQKNSRGPSVRHYGDSNNVPLKIASRKQYKERESLIEKGVSKAFPKEKYGVLNQDLEIVSGEDAERSQREEQKRLSSQGFARGLRPRPTGKNAPFASSRMSNVKHLKERPTPDFPEKFGRSFSPMRDSGTDYTSDRRRNSQRSDAARQDRSSLLDREDVRSAWGRSTSDTARRSGDSFIRRT